MHSLAKTFKVVTPYSSMIVLVDEAQREQLKAAEAKSDRFERKVESGKENLTKPNNPFNVSGTPEPEEWLLLGVGAIGLLAVFLRQRRAKIVGWKLKVRSRKDSETGFLNQISVRMPKFSQKPGFLPSRKDSETGFLNQISVRMPKFSQKPGFLPSRKDSENK